MRLTIVSRIYRPEPSAASLFLGAVADAMLADGHRVDVITAALPKQARREHREEHREAHRGERVRTFPVLRDRNGYVRGILQYLSFDLPLFFRLLFARRADVVLVEPPPTTGAMVRVVCALRRMPYVYNAADVWSDAAQLEPTSGLIVRLLRVVEGFALRGATRIVTISRGVEGRLRSFGVRRPITVSGFGAATHEFPLAVADPQRLFVYAGSYAPAHGAEILVDALADFLQTHPGYTLRFVGNGVERPLVEARAAERGVSAHVEYLDPVPPRDLLPHLGAAVASLATIKSDSVYEYAYASKIFSSLSAGCPVIFAGPGPTNAVINAANEAVRAGLTADYEPRAIADAMRAMADRPPSADERAALSEWTAGHHSIESVARQVGEALVSAVRSRS